MQTPRCGHVVLACMDFRFQQPLRRFLAAEGLEGDADLLSWPGGAACLTIDGEAERALEALALARRLHGCDRAVLVTHEDCMRLGGSAAHADPQAEVEALTGYLRDAAGRLRASVPELEVRLVRLTLAGDAIEVDD